MDTRKERKFAKRATFATVAGALTGAAMLGGAFNYTVLGDTLEAGDVEFSQTIEDEYNQSLQDILQARDNIGKLSIESDRAYRDGDVDHYNVIKNNLSDEIEEYEDSYESLLVDALTNKFFSEYDYKDLIETIEAEDLPTEVGSIYNGVSSRNAEYLNACRAKATDGLKPLEATSTKANQVSRCMRETEHDHNIGVIFGPIMGMQILALLSLLPAVISIKYMPPESLNDGYRRLYRRMTRKSRLGNN